MYKTTLVYIRGNRTGALHFGLNYPLNSANIEKLIVEDIRKQGVNTMNVKKWDKDIERGIELARIRGDIK